MPSPTLIRAVEQWGGASAVPVAAALGGAGGGARRARRQRAVALRFVGAPGVLLGPLYRQPRQWSGAGGAGERDGTRRRVAGGAVRGSLPLYRVNDGRRRSVSVRGSLGTATCERLERDRRRARERPVARAGASLVRARRAARGGVLGSGPAQRGGPSRARRAAWPERGPRRRVPVEGAAGWSRGQEGPGHARGREERKEREREGERVGADRGRGRPRVASAACDAQAEGQTGMGQRKIWVPARFLGVSGSQAEDETRKGSSSTTKQGLARDLFLLDFWDVTNLPHLK